jgi:hypothetical protein
MYYIGGGRHHMADTSKTAAEKVAEITSGRNTTDAEKAKALFQLRDSYAEGSPESLAAAWGIMELTFDGSN